MESINIVDPPKNENSKKDAQMQEELIIEATEKVAPNEANSNNEVSGQLEIVEESIKNSSTCVELDKISAAQTQVGDKDINVVAATNIAQSKPQVPASQVESMEQSTIVQSQETIVNELVIAHEATIGVANNTECTASDNCVTEESAIEAVASKDYRKSAASTAEEAAVLNRIETNAAEQEVAIVTEQNRQQVKELPKNTEPTEIAMIALNEEENNITAKPTDDVPQIIENLILVKATINTMDAVNEAHPPALTQPEPETPMETSDNTSLENTSQIVELPAIFPSLKTRITPSQTGLAMLAQYDSDDDSEEEDADSDEVSEKPADNEIERISDTESVVEVPTTSRDYRSRVVEIDSDSDSETDSSDSDVASEVSYLAEIRKAIDKSIDVDVDADAADEDEYDDNGTRTKRQPPRVKGEFLIDDLPPIEDLHITVPEAECVELGKVHSIVDQLVLVNALPNSVLLDLETVLFLDKGQRVLGEVFDVLGQVADPLYCVRFNSNKQILEKNIKIGETVFVAPKTQYTQFVILSSLMKMRGSDASWENDVEPPPRYLDYSDDEQERDARARLRNRDRSTDHWDPSKRARSELDFSSPSPSMSPSPSPSPFPRNPFHHQMRPRGGRGGYRPPRYQHTPQEYHQRPNYNAGSWHSNYPHPYGVPTQSYAAVPSAHVMYAQPPPSNFAAYPPQAVAMQPYTVAPPNLQQPPPQVYVLNPYAVRPPVLAHNSPQPPMYTTVLPPPPPPGNI